VTPTGNAAAIPVPVPLEQGEPGEFFVPLVTQRQDEPFLVELRYVVTGARAILAGPDFPREPATQQVYLSAYVPRELTYLGSAGPWNDEIVWGLKGFNAWPKGNKSGSALINWVTEGLDVDRGTLGSFPTDGRHLLFSTLRPAPGADGALRLVLVRGWILQTVVLALIIGLGVLLLPAPFKTRAVAVGIALVMLLLDAVFAPSVARSVVNNATVAAGLIVLVVWGLWFLLVTVPRSPVWQERRRARQRATTPPPTPTAPPPPASQSKVAAQAAIGTRARHGSRMESRMPSFRRISARIVTSPCIY
jgi:hypothetical protein